MTDPSIEPFLRSSSHETVVDTFLELLAQRMVALERAAGAEEIRLLRAENRRLRERLAEWESPPLASIIIPPKARSGSAGVPPARGPEARAPRKLAGVMIKAPPLDHLVTFLPAIFRNFWGQVCPEEVAMFAGSAEIPVIPSPCPELSRDELEARKRRLLQLPLDELMKVLIACRRLQQSYRLEVRPELAPFMRMLP